LIRPDLVGASPPTWISLSISPGGAAISSPQVGNREMRRMNARPEFVSDVFCERIVSTSSVIASPCGRQTGRPYRAESRATISAGERAARARVLAIRYGWAAK